MYQLSEVAEGLSTFTDKIPVIIAEIDGLPIISSRLIIGQGTSPVKIGELGLFVGGSWLIGDETTSDTESLPLIDISKTTNIISQQLLQDKGGTGSITSFKLAVVDKSEIATQWITPGKVVDDILARTARVYINFEGGEHPTDSIKVFDGIVDSVSSGAGFVEFNISNPEQLKRTEIFPKTESKTSVISSDYPSIPVLSFTITPPGTPPFTITAVNVNDTTGFPSTGELTVTNGVVTYKMPYSSITPTSFVCSYTTSTAMTGVITATINNTIKSDTTQIYVDDLSIDNFDGLTEFEVYIKVEDEVIKSTKFEDGVLKNLTRGALGTTAIDHPEGSDVETTYRLKGTMVDLALKTMLSTGRVSDGYITKTAKSIVNGTTITNINSIFFQGTDILLNENIQLGDKITVSAAAHPANNRTETITDFGIDGQDFYVTVTGLAFTAESSGAKILFKSKYDVLPDGLAMKPSQVDIARHLELESIYGASFFEYDFWLKDTIKGSDFVNTQIYYPSGCYMLPRNGQASIGVTTPPTALTKTVSIDNVIGASRIKIDRSITNNFYNAVIYKYDEDFFENKLLRGKVNLSADSTNRIKIKNKPLTIKCGGIRGSSFPEILIQNRSRGFLDRYQYGAESWEVQVLFGFGYNLECGDIIIFDGTGLQMSDTENVRGDREFQPRAVEIVNKTMNIKTGEIKLKLLDTAYSLDGRYGGWGPSSVIASGSTTTNIKLSNSYGNSGGGFVELSKWSGFIGEHVTVHSEDWSFAETVQIIGVQNPDILIVEALSSAPSAGYIVDDPVYPVGSNPFVDRIFKATHCSFNAQVTITAVISDTEFQVSPSDALKLQVGGFARIHSETYSTDGLERKISSVTGNNFIIVSSAGYTPIAGDIVDLIGYEDGGAPYRWL